MRAPLLLCALLVLAGCTRAGEDPNALLNEVKKRLGERDTRLTSYRLEGRTSEGGAEPVGYTFAYRSPQRMRASLGAPLSLTFAWDGEKLFELNEKDKRLTTFTTELPPERRAGFLTETFAPFTAEGFRAPLLPLGATARRTTHPRAQQAVALAAKVADPAAEGLELSYTLRWPSMDFLGKSSRASDGTTTELRVEEEHCDEALKLCVPKRLTRWVKGEKVSETTLSVVELNPSLPNDTFSIAAPEGYEVLSKTLVDAAAK